MVGAVRETGEAPPADPELSWRLAPRSPAGAEPKKKRG
jgi:hypothetical protein